MRGLLVTIRNVAVILVIALFAGPVATAVAGECFELPDNCTGCVTENCAAVFCEVDGEIIWDGFCLD